MDQLATRKKGNSDNANRNNNNNNNTTNKSNTNNFRELLGTGRKDTNTTPVARIPTTNATVAPTKTTLAAFPRAATIAAAALKKPHKLKRSTEKCGHFVIKEPATTTRTTTTISTTPNCAATTTTTTTTTTSTAASSTATTIVEAKQTTAIIAEDDMGGGFTTPPAKQMYEKLKQQQQIILSERTKESRPEAGNKSSKKERPNKTRAQQADETKQEKDQDKDKFKERESGKEKEKEKPRPKGGESPLKPLKELNFAARLRRSFRRAEHKSLEINRSEGGIDTTKHKQSPRSLQDNRSFITGQVPRQASDERSSVLSLAHLPGIGGYINPALLLDSPDESTPPEFNYRHLSSVATTNSSTSIDSNDLIGDLQTNSSLGSLNYVGLQQSSSFMGGEVSISSEAGANNGAHAEARPRPKLRKQNSSSSKSDCGFVNFSPSAPTSAATTSTSRSCSTTSESSSAKLTRLQNFLFKSSGDSMRSYLGHSNDGFTASSHNSSSGEWENLATFGSLSEAQAPADTIAEATSSPVTGHDGNGGDYYQYTLTSPTNPFLPEITARTYRSSYAEQEEDTQHASEVEELDANVTSVKYIAPRKQGSPLQRSTPSCSRTSSQEEQQHNSAASTPGRQKRKLFQLYSPQTRMLLPSSGSGTVTAADTAAGHSLNPFLSDTKEPAQAAKVASPIGPDTSGISATNPSAAGNSSPKGPPVQSASSVQSSPMAVPQDLNARREEFLRATMKICLVVSPPSAKLQLKSKSLTHLDGLDSLFACRHATATTGAAIPKPKLPESLTAPQPFSLVRSRGPYCSRPAQLPSSSHTPTHSPHLPRSLPTRTSWTGPSLVHPIQSSPQTLSPTTRAATLITAVAAAASVIGTASARSLCLTSTDDSFASSSGNDHTDTTSISLTSVPAPIIVPQPPSYPTLSLQNNLESPSAFAAAPPIGHQNQSITATPTADANSFCSQASVSYGSKLYKQRKKALLYRSEISSSEYFSVSFCNENGYLEEEFLPATKGVTLSSALSELLKRRNLNFSEITITDNNLHGFLEAGGPSSHASSLDENTEVDHLAGHHLIIAERDGSRKTLQKAASFGSRTRPPRLLSSVSTEETTEPGDQRTVPGKQLKQRWSGLFGIKNPHQNQLCELLNGYAKVGVPQQKTALSFDHPQFDGAQEYLDNMHKSWKDFVQHEEISDGETKIQTAIWELVTTEVYYIHALQTVTDLFLACLEAVQGERLLTDVDQNRLFSNVRDICEANLKFWTLYLYPMVANSVATHEPLRIEYFQPGFITFATTFAPYKKYCAEQSTCQFYCKELNRTNALFTSYLAWCESQKMCNRLRLADILVRPMQRLTKYSLLLAAIKKNMTDDDDIEAMDTMIHTVENFVCSVNNHLTTRQETERLKGVMARIECYDVVDTNNELLEKMVKQHSHMFDLCAPMKGCANHQVRHLFMEGDHKFKDPLGKADVHCFLLTDILLVCKSIAKKGLGALKVIRQPYLTDRLMVHHNSNSNTLNCVYLNEFQVAVTAFTLQCSEAKNWYETLKRTKIIYTRLKQGGGSNWEGYRFGGIGAGTVDSLGVKKSPLNSSIGSRVTSANNSHSGSVEWNDSRNISVDFEKTNSLSSDEGCSLLGGTHHPLKLKSKVTSPQKLSVITSSANTLSVQPLNLLGQSLPNLNLHHSQTNNTLLVPGTTSSHSGNLLLCPSHRGISYPPPSPTRVPLRRGMAFSASIKNPPLVKTRNITSQNSINWHQIPSTPTPTSPQTVESGSLPRAPPLAGGSAGSTHPHPLIDTSHSVGSILQKQPQLQPATSGTTPSNETDV